MRWARISSILCLSSWNFLRSCARSGAKGGKTRQGRDQTGRAEAAPAAPHSRGQQPLPQSPLPAGGAPHSRPSPPSPLRWEPEPDCSPVGGQRLKWSRRDTRGFRRKIHQVEEKAEKAKRHLPPYHPASNTPPKVKEEGSGAAGRLPGHLSQPLLTAAIRRGTGVRN